MFESIRLQDKILSGKAAEDRHNSNLAKKLASTENTIQEVVGLAGQVHLNFQNNNGRNFHWQVNHNQMNEKMQKRVTENTWVVCSHRHTAVYLNRAGIIYTSMSASW